MKHPFIFIGIWMMLFFQTNPLHAQCDPSIISTNPDAPSNPENPEKLNTFFDWRDATFQLNYISNGRPIQSSIPSPFYQSNNSEVDFLYQSGDYEPKDGWELIRRDFGYNDDGSLKPDLVNPYLILYNKFTGILRVFLALGDRDDDYDAFEIQMNFSQTSSKKTGIFGQGSSIMEPVKTFDPSVSYSSIFRFLNQDLKWMVAEFTLAYDPCTCQDASSILIDGSFTQSASVVLSGATIDSLISIENQEGRIDQLRFNSSLLKTGKKVKGGKKTYKSLDQFTRQLDRISQGASANFNGGPDSDAKEGLSTLAKNVGTKEFLKEGLESVSYLGDAASMMHTFVAGGKQSPFPAVIPGPFVMEKESEFSGFIESSRYTEILFNNPGSSPNRPAGEKYPYYNEVLGVMSVLQRPKIQPTLYQETEEIVSQEITSTIHTSSLQFSLTEDVLYAINPATEFKQAEVDMLGAIFVRNEGPYEFLGLIKVRDGLYRTPYLPPSCLNGYVAEVNSIGSEKLDDREFQWYFQLVANLERTDVADAQNVLLINSYQVEMLPLQTSSNLHARPSVAYPNLLGENVVIENQTLEGGTILYATQQIRIGPNVQITGSGSVTLVAGNDISTVAGIDLPEGVKLQVGRYPLCQPFIPPATSAQIQDICNSEQYRSRANNKDRITEEFSDSESPKGFTFHSYPNPISDDFTIEFELPTEGYVSVYLYDMMGREISRVVENRLFQVGNHQLKHNGENLAAGMYQLTATFNRKKQTIKIIKTE